MNNERRKAIDLLIKEAEALKARYDEAINLLQSIKDDASDLKSDVEGIKDEEQEYMDNMHENLQQGERYCNAEAAVSALDTACEKLDDLATVEVDFDFDDLISSLDEAKA